MGLCITLEDEVGDALETLTDERNLLHKLLPSHDHDSYPLLASIDWYGDTIFNGVQMNRFVAEWERLSEGATAPEEKTLVSGVRALALRCKNGVHLYLKFIGD